MLKVSSETLQAESPSQHQLPKCPWFPISPLCNEEEQMAAPRGVLGSRQTGPHSSRIWSKGTVSKFPVPADRWVEYRLNLIIWPGKRNWKVLQQNSVCVTEKGIKNVLIQSCTFGFYLPVSLLACCPSIWAAET